MKILAIETSSNACSIALLFEGKTIAKHEVMPQQHASVLLSWIQELLGEVGINVSHLDAVAYSCGPGSFTGIRIGAAVGQGIALAKNKPLLAVPSLQVISQGAHRVYETGHALVILDARMNQIYGGQYTLASNGLMKQVKADWLGTVEELEAALLTEPAGLIITDIAMELQKAFPTLNLSRLIQDFYPDAKEVLLIAQQMLAEGKVTSVEEALPIYIRSESTWKKIKS